MSKSHGLFAHPSTSFGDVLKEHDADSTSAPDTRWMLKPFRWCNPCFSLSWQMYVTCTVQAKGTRLAKPVLSLGLMCLAFLTGLNRVAEYRNHWSDVIAGFIIGTAIAAFLVSLTSTNIERWWCDIRHMRHHQLLCWWYFNYNTVLIQIITW